MQKPITCPWILEYAEPEEISGNSDNNGQEERKHIR